MRTCPSLRSTLGLALALAAASACGDDGARDPAADASDDATTAPDGGEVDDAVAPPPDAAPDTAPPAPTLWSAEATEVVDDVLFATHQGQRLFALGYDARTEPIWDGVTGKNGCDPSTGEGYLDVVLEGYDRALAAGANFVFVWGYPGPSWPLYEEWLDRISQHYGGWHPGYGSTPPAERDVIPILYNRWGETDFNPKDLEGAIAEQAAEFEEWRTRTGRYAPEAAPNLPPYDELPWLAWHPTWRSAGGGAGDGTSERLTDDQARRLINSTNMAMGDNYTYVTNRHDSVFNVFSGQKGEPGEGYDDWLAVADPEHQEYFEASWIVMDAVDRFAEIPILRWMWLQGYSFGFDIQKVECETGGSDAWAKGWFPSFPYLRKEAAATIAAGGTGLVFFGYLTASLPDRERVDALFRALSHPDVYGPALLSPRLDLGPGQDPRALGEGGRVKAIVKWDADGRRAYVIGANPGPWETAAELVFPWTLDRAEMLMWGSGRYVASPRLTVDDRTLRFVAPMDEGFILRVTPRFE